MSLKSPEYMRGFTDALVFLSDIFETRSEAFFRHELFKRNQIKLVIAVIDACIRRRETLADVGPRNMNLFVRKDRRVELKEK